MLPTAAYAAEQPKDTLHPFTIERRAVGPEDVQIEIAYCGVCHTDLHFVNNDWGRSNYPLVPGHEIIGHVRSVGAAVTRFKPGDRVAVGCMVDSCGTCPSCSQDLEQYCHKGMVATYNSETQDPGNWTFGGYSKQIVCKQSFVLQVPENLDLAGAAPLLCAGITTYSPLRHWEVGPGQKVGIIGLGGLGHMGIKFAKALGAQTVMITTSSHKGEDARRLGADEVLLSTDSAAMAAGQGQFDFLLNTIPVSHDVNPYLGLLRLNGTMCVVGAPEPLAPVHAGGLIFGRKRLAGSLIGGIRETQEMLDFCGEHQIHSDIEMIRMDEINAAYLRMQKNDVKYRFVIDMSTLG